MSNLRINFILFLITSLLLSFVVANSFIVHAAISTHLVISEVQFSGVNANDEFVELYNPSNTEVDITGWRLTRKTSTGTQSNLVSSLSGIIPAHSYFLVAPAVDYLGTTTPDMNYSTGTRIAADNTILIYSDAGLTLVDKFGVGSATDFEGNVFPNNSDSGGSIERKANSSSTTTTMSSGGVDELLGNGEDTDNNANDFVIRTASEPQNSISSTELPEANPSPTPSLLPSPSSEPSINPSPEISPSPSPSVSPSPTMSSSVSPSVLPTPSISPSPSALPSNNPNGQIIGVFPFSRNPKVCYLNYKQIKIAGLNLFLPKLSCNNL